MTEKKEPDVVLSDGREIRFNLKGLKLIEWREFISPLTPDEVEDAILARVSGLTAEEVPELDYMDWRLLCSRLLKVISRPLDDPNSASGSTST